MKTFKQLLEGVIQPNGTDKIKVEDLKSACWKGYEAIGMKKKNGRDVPNCVPVKEEALDEGKMAQLHADIEDHLGKHVANYKKMGGAEHLANKAHEAAKKIAKLHNISHEAAQKHVNDYVDHNLKESVNEAVDKEHPIYKEYQSLKKQPLKDLKDQIKRQHRVIDTSEFRSKEHAASHILHNKHGAHRMKAVFGESLEHLDEISKQVLGSYIKKASHSAALSARFDDRDSPKAPATAVKRLKGIAKATDKLTKEEAEQIDEISKDTLHSYIHKAFAQGNDLHYDLAHSRGDKATDAERKALQAKISKRNTGIMKAGKKLREGTSMLSFDDYLKEEKCGCKKEELHPNQKKLDKNHNGKLDSDDFVKLRASKNSKKEVDEKYVSDAQRKAVWASKNEKGVKEEVELDEAMTPMQKLKDALDRHSEKAIAANKAGDDEAVKVHQGYMNKIKTKMGKLAKNEEVEQIDETLKGLYHTSVKNGVFKHANGKNYLHDKDTKAYGKGDKLTNEPRIATFDKEHHADKAAKQHGGTVVKTAIGTYRVVKEEVEQIDEISKSTLGSYVKKASNDAVNKMYSAGYTDHMSHTERNKGNDALAKAHSKHAGKSYSKSVTRLQGIRRASERLAKEEVEQISEDMKAAAKSMHDYASSHGGMDKKDFHTAAKHMEAGDHEALAKHIKSLDSEPRDKIISTLHKHGNDVKRYGYLVRESVEQIDELSKATLKSYQSKIGHDLDRAMDAMPHGTGNDKEDRKLNNRMVGDERAQKRLMKKEETDVLTFKELMQNISEAAIDDLKDRIAARKATQSAYDKDYKPAAKTNVQKVKGHSYGAGEEEGGEDDEDTKKVSKPAEPAVKRGRGRPAGSKSGARN